DALAIKFGRRLHSLVEHDLFGKPASTFPDHALATLLGLFFELSLQRRELGERRIRIGRFLAPLVPLVPRHMSGRLLPLAARMLEALIRALPAAAALVAFGPGRLGRLGRP